MPEEDHDHVLTFSRGEGDGEYEILLRGEGEQALDAATDELPDVIPDTFDLDDEAWRAMIEAMQNLTAPHGVQVRSVKQIGPGGVTGRQYLVESEPPG